MAAWDAYQVRLFGLCCASMGIDSIHDLVTCQAPYKDAKRVFLITDSGSYHRVQASMDRLERW